MDSTESTLSGGESRILVARRRSSLEGKDKSHKRKSHLNRGSTSEEALYPPHQSVLPAAHWSDSCGEHNVEYSSSIYFFFLVKVACELTITCIWSIRIPSSSVYFSS